MVALATTKSFRFLKNSEVQKLNWTLSANPIRLILGQQNTQEITYSSENKNTQVNVISLHLKTLAETNQIMREQ